MYNKLKEPNLLSSYSCGQQQSMLDSLVKRCTEASETGNWFDIVEHYKPNLKGKLLRLLYECTNDCLILGFKLNRITETARKLDEAITRSHNSIKLEL